MKQQRREPQTAVIPNTNNNLFVVEAFGPVEEFDLESMAMTPVVAWIIEIHFNADGYVRFYTTIPVVGFPDLGPIDDDFITFDKVTTEWRSLSAGGFGIGSLKREIDHRLELEKKLSQTEVVQ